MKQTIKQRAYFKTIIRGTRIFIYDREGKLRKIITMHRKKEPIFYEEVNLQRNPDKIVFSVITNQYNDRLEIFSYKNMPNLEEKVFFSVNGQVIGATVFEWRKIQSGMVKCGKFLGLLK